MTVGELREKLAKCDSERLVVLSRDSEGNGYSTVHSVDDSMTFKDGEVGLESLTPEDIKNGYGEEDVKEGSPCVVIYP